MSSSDSVSSSDGVTGELAPGIAAKLTRAVRAVFPHDGLGDGPYERSVSVILENVAGSMRQTGVVVEGVRSLEALAGAPLEELDVDELGGILRHITQTEFFQILLTSTVVTLYSDPETWEYLGYEGFSSDKGGYLNRGFDDLDWLPAARIDEYGGEPLVGYMPAVPGRQVSFETEKKVPTI